MKVTLNRLVIGTVTAGAVVCLLATLMFVSTPFSESIATKWAGIRQSWKTQGVSGSFSFDTVVVIGRHRPFDHLPQAFKVGDSFELLGWAFDPNFYRTADRFIYRVDGGAWRDAAYHVPRPDVAAALHFPNIADCGFVVTIPPGTMTAGRHLLEFATVEGLATPLILTEPVRVNVSAS